MTIQEKDIIIIGGGPAGSTAGRILSGLGYSVLIIDKKKFPREKLCGGLTTYKNIRLLERVFNETEENLVKNGIINYRSYGYEFRNRNRSLFNHSSQIPLYFVDRIVYDDFLLKKAIESGAGVIQGENVVECNIDENIIETENNRYKAGYIIAADGVNSMVRKKFPRSMYNWRKWKRNLGSTFEIFVKRADIRDEVLRNTDIPVVTLGLVPWGFAWIFPRTDRLAIGIGGLYQKSRGKMLKAFRDFLKEKGIDHSKYIMKGYNIPLGGYVSKPVYKNVMLAGDAGGFVDPILGEGIFYAQRTAELAAWAIHWNITEGRPLDKVYRKLLWKYVLPEFFDAKIIRILGFYFSDMMGHYPLQIWITLLGRLHQEMLHGIRTNRLFFKRTIHEKVSLNFIARLTTRPGKKD